MEAIVSFFTALPRIVTIMQRVGAWLSRAETNAWLSELEATIDSLERAQTSEEKQNAARRLVGVINGIR